MKSFLPMSMLMAEQFGVKQAPTLVVVKDGTAQKYAGVSDIKKMLNV